MLKEKISNWRQFQKLKALYKHYERYLLPAMLLLGVAADFFTFQNLQISTSLQILGGYLAASAGIIVFINLYQEKKISGSFRLFSYFHVISPLLLQFFFGALLSASLVFYWFSGSFSASWPVIAGLSLLILLNERFRELYLRPVFQLSIFYFAVFTYFSVAFPFILKTIDAWVFLLSGVCSLLLISFFVWILTKAADAVHWFRWKIIFYVFAIFSVMNLFYYFNFIPPIPLAIRDAGVYHSVQRYGDGYLATTEEGTFLDRIIPGQLIKKQEGERIYVYNSIFAPLDLKTRIYHQWYYFDEQAGKWEKRDRLSYALNGGREGGFRGYTIKSSLEEGKWRVDVETERGQVLGRIHFYVQIVNDPPELYTIAK